MAVILHALSVNQDRFAMGRYADGERALLECRQIPTADGWKVPQEPNWITRELWGALRDDTDGWHLGLGCACCDIETHKMLRSHATLPESRRTFSSVFVNGNHDDFRDFCTDIQIWKKCHFVACAPHENVAQYIPANQYTRIDANAVNKWHKADLRRLVDKLLLLHRPILLAAGPLGAVIANRYWHISTSRQSIVDIGSALDPLLHGRSTRNYLYEGHPNRRKHCTWWTGTTN